MHHMNQVYLVVALVILSQYSLNYLSYYDLMPDILGISLNGITKNTSYIIPGTMAILGTLYFESFRDLKRILYPYLIIPKNPVYWIIACWIMIPTLYVALWLNDILYGRELILHVTDWPTWEVIKFNTPLFLNVAISDELFWIGFILPRLLYCGFSPLKASLAIGIFWGLDYVPFLWTDFLVSPGLNAPNLILGWFSLTPIYVWLYYRTGSAIIVLVFNLFMQFLYTAIPILPLVTGDNTGAAMANLVCFLTGLLIWKIAPTTNRTFEPLAHRSLEKANDRLDGETISPKAT